MNKIFNIDEVQFINVFLFMVSVLCVLFKGPLLTIIRPQICSPCIPLETLQFWILYFVHSISDYFLCMEWDKDQISLISIKHFFFLFNKFVYQLFILYCSKVFTWKLYVFNMIVVLLRTKATFSYFFLSLWCRCT